MKKATKKEIRKSIELDIYGTLTKYGITGPSHKGEKLLTAFSKKFADEVKKLLKKERKTANKVQKTAPKKVKKQVKKKE